MKQLFVLLAVVLIGFSSYSYAADSKKPTSGWADRTAFCKMRLDEMPFEQCDKIIKQYQVATKKHFETLSAEELRRISDHINKLSQRDSKESKKLKKAVKDIGKTLRQRIRPPEGVRVPPNIQQQYKY